MGSNPIARSQHSGPRCKPGPVFQGGLLIAIGRRSQVVKAGVCKTPIVGSNPTVAFGIRGKEGW
jgi:hypothetical protein